jgi:hypothetical protein
MWYNYFAVAGGLAYLTGAYFGVMTLFEVFAGPVAIAYGKTTISLLSY